MSAMKYVVIAFYKFFLIEGPLVLKRVLEKRCKELGIRGSIILSTEGINGTVAGKDYEIKSLIEFLKSIPGFSEMEFKESHSCVFPFLRMKICIIFYA